MTWKTTQHRHPASSDANNAGQGKNQQVYEDNSADDTNSLTAESLLIQRQASSWTAAWSSRSKFGVMGGIPTPLSQDSQSILCANEFNRHIRTFNMCMNVNIPGAWLHLQDPWSTASIVPEAFRCSQSCICASESNASQTLQSVRGQTHSPNETIGWILFRKARKKTHHPGRYLSGK